MGQERNSVHWAACTGILLPVLPAVTSGGRGLAQGDRMPPRPDSSLTTGIEEERKWVRVQVSGRLVIAREILHSIAPPLSKLFSPGLLMCLGNWPVEFQCRFFCISLPCKYKKVPTAQVQCFINLSPSGYRRCSCFTITILDNNVER